MSHPVEEIPEWWKQQGKYCIFSVQQCQKPEYFVRFADFGSLFVTHGMEWHKLTTGENGIDCNRMDELCTQQGEADTRILLYTSHAASNGRACIAIKSPIQMWRSLRARSVTALMPRCDSVSIRSNVGGTLTWLPLGNRLVKMCAKHCLECHNRMWQHKCIREERQKTGVPLRSSPTQTCALPWWWLAICSATTTNGSKDVLGLYAHCTETTAKTRTEFGTNCSAEIMHKPEICRQPNMLSSTMSHEQITRPAFGTIPWKWQLIRQLHMVMAGVWLTVTYPFTGWTNSLYQMLVLCIVSRIRYDTYRRFIDPIHDMYRDTYRIIHSITNIAETVIKTQHTNTCMHKISVVNRSHQPRC